MIKQYRVLTVKQVGLQSMILLSVGSLTSLLYAIFNLHCPWKSIGLACPGCGCSRAVSFVFNGKPLSFGEYGTCSIRVVVVLDVAIKLYVPLVPAEPE